MPASRRALLVLALLAPLAPPPATRAAPGGNPVRYRTIWVLPKS